MSPKGPACKLSTLTPGLRELGHSKALVSRNLASPDNHQQSRVVPRVLGRDLESFSPWDRCEAQTLGGAWGGGRQDRGNSRGGTQAHSQLAGEVTVLGHDVGGQSPSSKVQVRVFPFTVAGVCSTEARLWLRICTFSMAGDMI